MTFGKVGVAQFTPGNTRVGIIVSGLRVQGFGFQFWVLGFRVQGFINSILPYGRPYKTRL